MDLLYFVLPLILIGWGMVAYTAWHAFNAPSLDADFFAPAALSCFAAFLFCGPACLILWYALLLRAIHLSHKRS